MHRSGLHDAILVKDNHVGSLSASELAERITRDIPKARRSFSPGFVQIEVDDLEQFEAVLGVASGLIDMILLDNMSPDPHEKGRQAQRRPCPDGPSRGLRGHRASRRFGAWPRAASIGYRVGALTHSSVQLDFGLDLR